ncbi:MAG: fibrobacter succinogenes major paralogous domain-containing protein [Candidatus Marinimicrobia bacterium]|nr:fibrobacter succinogenes major paralogous domain-containing protein [Candidatus Neomarinimicrobiota bacterium]
MNTDGTFDILDIIATIDCIINDCWIEFIFACIDPGANNYHPYSYQDDGRCEYNDIDGNIYNSIIIGEQRWMVQNLRVTHYRNGDDILLVTENSEWGLLSTGAYSYYGNIPEFIDTYGNIYNWYAVGDDRQICLEGWHVPNQEEYQILVDYLGGTKNAGGALKSTGTIEGGDGLWYEPNTGATNTSGFNAFPGGWRGYYEGGSFNFMGNLGMCWSSSEFYLSDVYAWYLLLHYDDSGGIVTWSDKIRGYSVRCMRDAD